MSGFRAQWKELIYPIVTNRSQGSRLWDVDDNEYIDLTNGFGSIMLGHRPEFVELAIAKQLHEGFEIGPQSRLAGEVAKMFCEMTGNDRMTFCNTGSEAVMAAMRVARTVTGRSKVVMFSGDYHGTFDEVLVKGFTNKAGAPLCAPIAPGIPRENLSNITVLPYGTPESLNWVRTHARDLAAVLVEPVQSRHPDFQPVEFLRELRAITLQSDTALIFDEIVTGFRVHQGGCQALFDIRADLATYGKVAAGGMPIGILAGKAQFMDAIDGGAWQYGDETVPEVGVTFFAGTFVRHPLTLAATKAVLQHLREQGPALQQQLTERAARLAGTLSDIITRRNIPTKVERFGSLLYFGFPNEERNAGLFYYYMRENGIHLREGFPCFLTTAHSDADLDAIADAFEKSAVEMQQAGLLSGSTTDSFNTAVGSPSIVAESERPAEVPMTEAQREIFLAAMLGDDASCSFNESFSVHLRGPLQVDALREAVNALIARHEALRAAVDLGGATLHFRPELKLEIPLRDLSALEPSRRDAELNRFLAEDAQSAFDLTNGPLVRAQLVRLAGDYHILVFTSHHIVCDGWSTNVILAELARIYSDKVLHQPVELPPVTRFCDYANSHVHADNSNAATDVETYWLTQFRNVPPPLELPLDRPRGPVKGYAGATLRTQIDAETYRKIKQLGSKNGCTLFATLLAGFQTLLHRLSSQDDIVVGIPTAGQSLVEGGSLVGHCVNFLPIRTRFLQGQTFAALLAAVKKTLLDAYDHQSYTYGTLVRKLDIIRDPCRLPLMEVQFNLERIGRGADFAGLNVNVEPNAKAAVNFDLFVNIVESDQGLTIHCDYNTGLFDQATIARWLEAFRLLLLAGLSDPEQLVAALPVLTSTKTDAGGTEGLSAEEQALLAQWNETRTDYPRDKSIVAVFEDQVARSPEAVAVVTGDQQLTYRELNRRANRLARHLQRLGIAKEDIVACCLERSVELIVAVLGILKAGAAYAPLDPAVPKERLEYMLADTRAQVMLTQKKLIDAGLSKLAIPMIALDEANSPDRSESPENLNNVPFPDHLAYVVYTSGSTGRPKGVMTEHRNVVRLVKDTNYCAFGPSEVFLQFAPISFDASTFEIWGALLNGGRLVIMPPGLPSLEELGRVIREHGVTTLWLTAGLFHVMVEQRLEDLQPLRQLLAGGDVLSPWHVRQVLEKLPSLRLINGYGPTENTTFTCCHTFNGKEEVPDPVPIGRPISNTRVYVFDSAMQAVPIGTAGELLIAGDGLARGYLNAPELTESKFVTHVTAEGVTERLYRTGDQVRFLQGGTLQFLGRTDNQIKLRGYRIELEEIEAVLRRHPDIRQVCVVAEREGAGVKRLLAYCVPAANVTLSESALREHLRSALPQYMLPETFVTLDALPLAANGKVDREKLPSPAATRIGRAREYVAPSTPQEKVLADIAADILRIERVGATDNLFELGADSLQIFQIASRAAKATIPITPRLVLTHRTIRAVLGNLK
ncbi:MAG TPA: amino acid adenylation domain-containing protein, partial [Lacipirellulaceae bacterium]|nr:amino acid adenylation domain-containing protein [Lacipirellulaceae bacterium]